MGRLRKIISGATSRKQNNPLKNSNSANMQLSSDTENSSITSGSIRSTRSQNDENKPVSLRNSLNSKTQLHQEETHPNLQRQSSSRSSSSPDYFQMQMELAELRGRIKLLDSGTSKSELLDLLEEKDGELQKKSEQIKILNEKFHQITLGLDQMERERKALRHESKLYQHEQKEVKRQLLNREKEVQTLQVRCATQEQKLTESGNARFAIQKVAQENKDLLKQAQLLEKAAEKIPALQENIRELNIENSNLKEELKDQSEEATTEIEDLRNTIKAQEQMVASHERREDQFNEKIESLQSKNTTLETLMEETIDRLKADHMKEIEKLNESFKGKTLELEDEIKRGHESLSEKNTEAKVSVEELTTKVVILQGETDQAKKIIEGTKARVSILEDEKMNNNKKIDELQEETSLQAKTINGLESENEKKNDQISSLSLKIKAIEEKNARISDFEAQLHDSHNSLSELQKQNQLQKEEDFNTIEQLRQELKEVKSSHNNAQIAIKKYKANIEKKEARDAQLDEKLEDIENLIIAKNKIISDKELEIISLKNQLRIINSDVEEKTESSRKLKEENEKAISLFKEKQAEVDKLKKKISFTLESERMTLDQLKDAQEKIDSSEMQAAVIVNDLEEKLENAEEKLSALERDSLDMKEKTNHTVRVIQKQLMEAHNEKDRVEQELKSKVDQIKKDTKRQDHDYLLKLAEKEKRLKIVEENLLEKESHLNRLVLKFDKVKEENKMMDEINASLNEEIGKVKSRYEDDIIVYQQQLKEFQSRALRSKNQESSNKDKLEEVKVELEQRTKLLGEMVSHNKELDSDLREARSVVADLQEELNIYVKEKDDSVHIQGLKDKQLDDLKIELELRLHEEQDRSKNLELKLEKANELIRATRAKSKDFVKKETENSALKDKIARQEAYLKRLLQKQKGSRRTEKLSSGSASTSISEFI